MGFEFTSGPIEIRYTLDTSKSYPHDGYEDRLGRFQTPYDERYSPPGLNHEAADLHDSS